MERLLDMDLDLDILLLLPAGEAERFAAGEIDLLLGESDLLGRGEGDLENFLRGGGERERRLLYGAICIASYYRIL